MANPKTVSADQLTPHTKMMVRGIVAFSAITKLIEGKALEADIQRAQQRGRTPITKPYTRITINDVQVPCVDPNNPTAAERYVMERCYMSQSKTSPGLSYEGISKSPFVPWIAVRQGQNAVQIQPQGELAGGQMVTLVLEQFPAKSAGMHAGVSLIGVICEEEPKWRTGSGVVDLSALGLNFVPMETQTDTAPVAPVAPAAPAAPAQGAYSAPYAAPAAPGVATQPAGPFSAAPAAPAAPVTPAAPAAGFNPFDAAAPVYAAPGVTPAAPAAPGIAYDPSGTGEF